MEASPELKKHIEQAYNSGLIVGVLLGMAIILIVQALCAAMQKYDNVSRTEHMAPVNIKSTNRHWRFYSPYGFGLAGPAGLIAGNVDRSIISVSQQQREEDIAQSRWLDKKGYNIPQPYEAPGM